jgi:hypothetical protein
VMELSDITPKQRKIIKLILQKGYDIGLLINENIAFEDAIDLIEKGRKKLLQKEIGATTDDINS